MAKIKNKNVSPAVVREISVIIAMYNTENYIEECLRSLLNQTFQDFEVIIADDSSTDNSVAVAEKMIPEFDGRLKIVRMMKNSGFPGIPRNFALKQARGKYIYFLDSDDFLDPDTFETLHKIAEDFDADVVHCERYYRYIEEEDKTFIETFQLGELVQEPTLETSDISDRIKRLTEKRFLWWGCNKLYRREMINRNNIKFPNMTSFEDLLFTFMCIVCAKNYVRVPFLNYHYRIRQGSLSNKGRDAWEIARNMIEAVKFIEKFAAKNDFLIQIM